MENLRKFNQKFKRTFFIAKKIIIVFFSIMLLPLAVPFWIGFYIAKRITENKFEVVKVPKLKKSRLPYDSNKNEKESIKSEVFL